jgi:hypothetical protein
MHLLIGRIGSRDEIIPVAYGLYENEDRPERRGSQGHEPELRAAVRAGGRACRKHRYDERERRHHDKRGKAGSSPLDTEGLLMVRETSDQNAQADDTGTNDHHGGVHRVARRRRHVRATGKHH